VAEAPPRRGPRAAPTWPRGAPAPAEACTTEPSPTAAPKSAGHASTAAESAGATRTTSESGGVLRLRAGLFAAAGERKQLAWAGIGLRIRRQTLTQASGNEERFIAILRAAGGRSGRRGWLRLVRIQLDLGLRIELAGRLPIRAIASELSQAARGRRFAQLQAEVSLLSFGIVQRFFRRLKPKHLDFDCPGPFSERRERVVPIHVRRGDKLLRVQRGGDSSTRGRGGFPPSKNPFFAPRRAKNAQ